jgi:hypothetical protein
MARLAELGRDCTRILDEFPSRPTRSYASLADAYRIRQIRQAAQARRQAERAYPIAESA